MMARVSASNTSASIGFKSKSDSHESFETTVGGLVECSAMQSCDDMCCAVLCCVVLSGITLLRSASYGGSLSVVSIPCSRSTALTFSNLCICISVYIYAFALVYIALHTDVCPDSPTNLCISAYYPFTIFYTGDPNTSYESLFADLQSAIQQQVVNAQSIQSLSGIAISQIVRTDSGPTGSVPGVTAAPFSSSPEDKTETVDATTSEEAPVPSAPEPTSEAATAEPSPPESDSQAVEPAPETAEVAAVESTPAPTEPPAEPVTVPTEPLPVEPTPAPVETAPVEPAPAPTRRPKNEPSSSTTQSSESSAPPPTMIPTVAPVAPVDQVEDLLAVLNNMEGATFEPAPPVVEGSGTMAPTNPPSGSTSDVFTESQVTRPPGEEAATSSEQPAPDTIQGEYHARIQIHIHTCAYLCHRY
jgi:hypothetical protein